MTLSAFLLLASVLRAEPPSPPPAQTVKPAPRDTGEAWRDCGGEEGSETCDRWNPILSDIDAAQQGRSPEVLAALKLDYFGRNDCRAYSKRGLKKRELSSIAFVVIHQGGYSAAQNSETSMCRPGAAHYTIERDGSIFQLMGEEWAAPHAEGPGSNNLAAGINSKSIGIELALPKRNGPSCNNLGGNATLDDVLDACEPTDEQYLALLRLLADIAQRTSVTLDGDHVLGHCELANGGRYAHGDPRAFDWDRIGLDNHEKLERLRSQSADKTGHSCDWYLAYGEDGQVDRELSAKGTAALLRKLK